MSLARLRQSLSRFRRTDRGAASLEFVFVFLPLILLIFLIVQIAIAYHWMLSAQKGLEMAARLAAVTPPVHRGLTVNTGLGTRVVPRQAATGADTGEACYLGACEQMQIFTCWGGEFMPNADGVLPATDCDFSRFQRIYDEVDRFAYSLEMEDFAIAYEDVGLGYSGQSYVPLIVLAVRPQAMPMILRVFDSSIQFQIPELLATIVAEDLGN